MVKPKIPKNRKQAYAWLVLEKQRINKHFPSFKVRVNGERLSCQGSIQPTDFSSTYKVEIFYQYDGIPKVRVLEPMIPYDPKIHMFKDESLCLYYWKEEPWGNNFCIHETIIPWIAEWLIYYEIYQLTEKWLGKTASEEIERKVQQPED